MSVSVRSGNSIAGYEIPDPLVFLDNTDYERLDFRAASFAFQRDISDHRNPFERDRARILHSPFFRSLGGKSQIFEPNQSGFFRTRLTHSLEVAQTAKVMIVEMCEKYRELKGNPELSPWEQVHLCDLAEAAGLAHDIGQPPFGHIGEKALNDLSQKHRGEGFEANAQTLRILTKLDQAYPERPGFTKGVLAAVMKYKIKKSAGLPKFIYEDDWIVVEKACPKWRHDEQLSCAGASREFEAQVKKSRTLACQVMDLADEITYSGHDIEDILQTPLLRPSKIEDIQSLATHLPVEILNKIQAEVELDSGLPLDFSTMQKGWEQLQSRLLQVFRCSKAFEFKTESHKLRREHMNSAAASCRAEKDSEGNWVIRISQGSALRSALIKHVIVTLVHRDSKLVTLQRKGIRVIQAIFEELLEDGDELLPWEYRDKMLSTLSNQEKTRIYCDFIAEMTEEHLLRLYERLFESEKGVLTDFF